MTAKLLCETVGATLLLTISNPEHRNALGPAIYASGVHALEQASRDSSIRSVVLSGEGQHFCGGGQLQRLLGNRDLPPTVQADSIDQLHGFITAVRACPKPVIAAVEGAAAGAGFSLAPACDMIVASEAAVFIMAYAGVGLSPDGGGSWHLARALPPQLVAQMLMDASKVSATRLSQLGIVNRLCAPGQALANAQSWAADLNLRAPNAMASAKALINSAPNQDLQVHLTQERDHFVRNLHHANAGIGISSFLSKVPPNFLPE